MSTAQLETEREPVKRTQPFCDVSVFLPADFKLDSGEKLSRPELRIRVYGDLENPAIAVAGGISAGRNVADAKDGEGWWRDIVSPGGAVDLEKFCVIGFDFLPNAGETARTITTRDHARALADALDVVNVEKLFAFVGASYGGMIGLAFAAEYPERIEKVIAISAPDRAHPAATALRGVQRRVIDFAAKHGDAKAGVSLARQIAMVTYRTPEEFGERFDSAPGDAAGAPYDVCEYLIARGDTYHLEPQRYVTLSDSIDRHQVDPAAISADCLIVAPSSDRLTPPCDLRRLADGLGAAYFEFPSLYGHDAFLKNADVIAPEIKKFLEETTR
ncbi:MAG: homoserine O-succinyltransferase [Parvularculaceae bacterium]